MTDDAAERRGAEMMREQAAVCCETFAIKHEAIVLPKNGKTQKTFSVFDLTRWCKSAVRLSARDIRALPLPPEGSCWRPIETAPRDRSAIIVAVPGLRPGGPMIVGEAYFDPEDEIESWWWAGTSCGEYHDSPITETNGQPTHWQPLPLPPEGS